MGKKPKNHPRTKDQQNKKTLSLGPMHGYGIAQRIKQISDNVLTVEEGSLYPLCNVICCRVS